LRDGGGRMIEPALEGLSVFPCGADKRPACPGGFKSAVAGRDRIEDLFRQYPGALVGAPTGCASGFDVLDIDRGGEDWLATYDATYGLPATRIVATRSGGLHLYFQHRVGMKCSAGLLAPNVDIRSTGGYVILWHLAGCRVLAESPIAPWPGPMLELLHEATEARGGRAPELICASPVTIACQGDRYVPKPLYRKILELMRGAPSLNQRRVRGILRPLVEARENRNNELYKAALQFRELVELAIIDRANAGQLLFMSAVLNGYVTKRGAAHAWSTINSGLRPRMTGEAQISFDEGLAK
jgi:hypothetical protein